MNTTNKVDMHLKGTNVIRNPEFREQLTHWKHPLTVVADKDREELFDYVYFDSAAFIEQKFTGLDAGLEAWIWIGTKHISPEATTPLRGDATIDFFDAANNKLDSIIFTYIALPTWGLAFTSFTVPAEADRGTLHIAG